MILELAPISRIAESLAFVRGDTCKVTIDDPDGPSPCGKDMFNWETRVVLQGLKWGLETRAEMHKASVYV